jgi:hypothetical protein
VAMLRKIFCFLLFLFSSVVPGLMVLCIWWKLLTGWPLAITSGVIVMLLLLSNSWLFCWFGNKETVRI